MKYSRFLLSLWLGVLLGSPAVAAYDIQKGIHGMQWGSSISNYSDLTKVHEWGSASYYINSNMYYQTAEQVVPAVFYGFYKGRFFAVFIKLGSPAQFVSLERQFTARHGKPKTTHDPAARLTVDRWKDKDIRIKLKLRESPVEYKLAIYYAPLAARLNEEQLENIPPEAYGKTPPEKDKTSKPAPLLDY